MNLSSEIALNKLQQYCVYQDRCHSEVRKKLISLKVYGDELEEVMSLLIQDKYLDELRYACSYARGKFRIKRWGWNKIKMNLKQKQVSDYCIRKSYNEIDLDEYYEVLTAIFQKKLESCKDENAYICKQKAIKYCLGRGYEMEKVLEVAS